MAVDGGQPGAQQSEHEQQDRLDQQGERIDTVHFAAA